MVTDLISFLFILFLLLLLLLLFYDCRWEQLCGKRAWNYYSNKGCIPRQNKYIVFGENDQSFTVIVADQKSYEWSLIFILNLLVCNVHGSGATEFYMIESLVHSKDYCWYFVLLVNRFCWTILLLLQYMKIRGHVIKIASLEWFNWVFIVDRKWILNEILTI